MIPVLNDTDDVVMIVKFHPGFGLIKPPLDLVGMDRLREAWFLDR